MTTQLPQIIRELDSRTNDGLDIRLLWDPIDGRVIVTVTDCKHGDELQFEVHDLGRPGGGTPFATPAAESMAAGGGGSGAGVSAPPSSNARLAFGALLFGQVLALACNFVRHVLWTGASKAAASLQGGPDEQRA